MSVNIKITYFLYKLTHIAEYLQCIELFIVGKFIMHLVLHEFVFTMNKILKTMKLDGLKDISYNR